MTIEEVLARDTEFKYMLLNRLQQDLYGNRSLWAGNAVDQIAYMVAVWDDLKTKPEWLTRKELNQLSIRFARKELK